jgi:hypothetical protein
MISTSAKWSKLNLIRNSSNIQTHQFITASYTLYEVNKFHQALISRKSRIKDGQL